ncbi:odorant receptor 13a-like, partial [Leptopilina boulardi]|uniref:odorant receptor 13a-like n=1 Tax=Leptopilina boulardi TaxID=63433 RepID=UPI0021F54C28
MDGDEAANHCTSICKISLKIIGIWPDEKSEGFLTFCRVVIIFICITFFIILSQTMKLIMIWGDIEIMSEILCKVELPSIIILLMIYVIQKNKSELQPIVASINEDWNNSKSKEERMIMLKMSYSARKISLICLLLSQGTFNFHTAGEIYYNIIDKSNIFNDNYTRRLYILSHFPYETNFTPIFEITWFTQCLTTFLATVTYAGVHGFFGILIIHLCGQFAVLKYRLINVVDEIVSGNCKKQFQDEFAIIVKRHQQLNRFVVIIEDTFNMLLLVEILISTIEFCLQAFQLSLIIGKSKAEFPLIPLAVMIIYIAYMLAVFYVYCSVGEQLKHHSSEMAYAVYSCKWYYLQSSDGKNLLFLMQRAQKPCFLTAGKFFSISLETFN